MEQTQVGLKRPAKPRRCRHNLLKYLTLLVCCCCCWLYIYWCVSFCHSGYVAGSDKGSDIPFSEVNIALSGGDTDEGRVKGKFTCSRSCSRIYCRLLFWCVCTLVQIVSVLFSNHTVFAHV